MVYLLYHIKTLVEIQKSMNYVGKSMNYVGNEIELTVTWYGIGKCGSTLYVRLTKETPSTNAKYMLLFLRTQSVIKYTKLYMQTTLYLKYNLNFWLLLYSKSQVMHPGRSVNSCIS